MRHGIAQQVQTPDLMLNRRLRIVLQTVEERTYRFATGRISIEDGLKHIYWISDPPSLWRSRRCARLRPQRERGWSRPRSLGLGTGARWAHGGSCDERHTH
jgi:hypothetical protein